MPNTTDTVNVKIKMLDDGSIVIQNFQKKVNNAANKIKTGWKGVNDTFSTWLKTAAKMTLTIVGVTALVTSLSGAIRNVVKDTIEFDRQFTQVRTLLDESKVNVIDMREKIIAMGGALGDVENITRGTYQMISSGQAPATALEKIGIAAQFAQGGQVALKDAVSVGTTFLNAYGEAAGGLEHVFDVLWQTIKDGVTTAPELANAMGRVVGVAQNAGLSIEELSGSIAIMTQISQNTNESVTSMRGILAEIIKPSQEAAKEAERLGINFSVAGVKTMGFSAWLEDTMEKVRKGNGDLSLLWGRVDALNGVFQLTRNNLQNFKEEMEKMSNVTGNTSENFEKYKQSFQGAWETMKNRLQAIFISTILPALQKAANWITANGENIEKFVKNAIENFKSLVKIIVQFKDVLITVGKVIAVNFVITKIAPFFLTMNTGFANLVEYIRIAKLEGHRGFEAFSEGIDAAGAKAQKFSGLLKKIPTTIWISVGIVGAQIVGTLLASWFDGISQAHDREMAKIKELAEKEDLVVNTLTRKIGEMRRALKDAGAELFREAQARSEFFADSTDTLYAKQKRIYDIMSSSKIWQEYQNSLLKTANIFSIQGKSLEDLIKIYTFKKAEIAKNDDATRTWIERLRNLSQGAAPQLKNQIQGIIQELTKNRNVAEQVTKQTETLTEAMKNYSDALGIASKEKISDLMTRAAGLVQIFNANKDTFEVNTQKANALMTKIAELSTEMETFGVTASQSFQDTKKEVADLAIAAVPTGNQMRFLKTIMGVEIPGSADLVIQNFKKIKVEENKVKDKTKELVSTFADLSTILRAVIGNLSDLGVISEDTANSLNAIAGGVSGIGAGISAINEAKKASSSLLGTLQTLSGAFSVATSAVSLFTGILKLLSGKSGELEAVERSLQGLTGLSDDWGKKLEELAQKIGGTDSSFRALNASLAEMIRTSDIGENNFGQWVTKVREIFSTFERGTANAQETARNFGAAFSEILKVAENLGIEGGHQMTGLIMLAEKFGLKIQEIEEYTRKNRETATEGWEEVLKVFSDAKMPVLDELVRQKQMLASIPEDLKKGIEGLTQSLTSYSNIKRLTQTEFDEFNRLAGDSLKKLEAQGITGKDAILAMKPLLEKMAFLQQQYGLQLDDTTKGLLEQGIQAGIISEDMRTDNEKLVGAVDRVVDAIDRLATGLGIKVPDAIRGMEDAAGRAFPNIQREVGAWSHSLSNVENQISNSLPNAVEKLDESVKYHMTGHSIVTETEKWAEILKTVDTDLWTIGDTIRSVDTEYTILMRSMADATERFAIDAEGNIKPLLNMLASIGNQTASSIGSKYKIYTDEEKQEMTVQFYQLAGLWQKNRDILLSDSEIMRSFVGDITSLVVIDEAREAFQGFTGSLLKYFAPGDERGLTWTGTGWEKPVSAASGISFIVPPGYEPDLAKPYAGYPVAAHSGELVKVFTREETRQILDRGSYLSNRIGSDITLPASPFLTHETLNDFFNIRNFDNDEGPEVKFNDGMAPVYIPKEQKKEIKIELTININMQNTPPVIIQTGNNDEGGINKEELKEVFSEIWSDNMKGIADEITESVRRRIESET